MARKRAWGKKRRGKAPATRQSPSKQSVPESESDGGMDADGVDDNHPESTEAVAVDQDASDDVIEDVDCNMPEATDAPEPEVPTTSPQTESNAPAAVAVGTNDVERESKNGINMAYWSTLLTEKSYLVDVSLGYIPENNLKQPLKYFSSDDEVNLFPMIELMSAELYNIVQKMSAAQKKDVEAAIKSRKGIIKIPNTLIKAYLLHQSTVNQCALEKLAALKRTPHPFLLTEDETMFTEEKLKLLRAVLDNGWKREVVMRSPGSTGRKTGDVYYYSPDGTKFRSSKQVAQHLAELQDSPFTIENFSFAKVRISTDPDQEIVRKAYDGKPPPRSPPKAVAVRGRPSLPAKVEASKPGPKPSSSKDLTDVESRIDEPVKVVSSRRSIQLPKRYSGDAVILLSKRPKMQDDKHRNSNSKGLMQMGMLPPKYPKGMEDSLKNMSDSMDYNDTGSNHEEGSESNSGGMKELAEDSLFQISALRQSGGIDVEKMRQYVENQKKMAQKAAAPGRSMVGLKPKPTPGGSKGSQGAVIPCSIRCPGMLGVIPNLQCTNCLCLFHAECLGLPPNLMFSKKYLCSNCTEQGVTPTTSSSAAAAGTSTQQKPVLKKPSELKRGPPGLAPLPPGHSRVPVPGRDITVTIAGREHMPVRLPQRGMGGPPGMVRGVMRGRGGGVVHHVRPPPQRMIAPDHGSAMPRMIPAGAQMMRRGRGRPPAMPMPVSRSSPHVNRNLTITQLPRMQGPPPVPNLQPMSTPKTIPSKLPLPPVAGVKPRQQIAVPNLMKSNAFRVAVPPPSLSGRTFKKASPPSTQQSPSNLRLSHPQGAVNRTPPAVVYTTVPDRTISLVKRSPQTVCMIGNKKFVVLPKNKKARDFNPANMVGPVGNGGLARGNYTVTVTEGRGTPESNLKKINDDVPIRQQLLDYINSTDNATNAKESVGRKLNESSANDDMPISEQMLSYDNENSQNSQEQGNGNIHDSRMESRTLTDVTVTSAD